MAITTKQQLNRVIDAIAQGTIGREEARERVQELRDKKERLMMELHSFDERESLQKELTQAIQWISGDLEQALWAMFKVKEKQRVLGRIVRLIFKPHSVSVQGYFDKSLKAHSSHPEKRKARIVEYELKEEFRDLDLRGLRGLKKLDDEGNSTEITHNKGKGPDPKIKIGVVTSSVAPGESENSPRDR